MSLSPWALILDQTLVDIDLFSHIRRIETALSDHRCDEALTWCSENKVALRKVKVRSQKHGFTLSCLMRLAAQSTLEFELRLQEYIELCRERKTAEAIAYMNKYLSQQWYETHMTEISKASALLAFPPTTTCRPYKVR